MKLTQLLQCFKYRQFDTLEKKINNWINIQIAKIILTSGKSQWSKDACKKFLAADLYLRVANSANPAAHLNLVRTNWFASLPLF